MMDEAEFGGISEDDYNRLKKEVTMAKKKKAKKKKTKKKTKKRKARK
jgi:hypothetical protein